MSAGNYESAKSPFVADIGAQMEDWQEGYIRMSLQVEEKHTNANGVMHGGVAMAVMDELMGAVVASVRGMDEMWSAPHSTVDMSISFIGGVTPGDDLVFEGRATKVGRSVAFAEADLHRRGEEKLLARGKFTFVIPEKEATT